MWRTEAGLLCCLCVATMLLPPCTPSGKVGGSSPQKSCKNDEMSDYNCGVNERCVQPDANVTPYCQCIQGYEYVGGVCTEKQKPSTEPPTINKYNAKPDAEASTETQGGNSVAAFLLVPTCLILFGALAYFGARRYKWLQRFRQFRQNRYGSVLVTRDDTDDDDPPIA